ncbi:MAG: BlaI/MecI/CopY family transcriptional regulator [Verrucomicrobia bacterium]|nr:BlaI/MecI/CopY family transcriptional regulator [Verrucomicrobiota bacterium]
MPAEPKRISKKSATRSTVPQISDAERVVMKVVWERRTATANQVVEALEHEMDWKPKTIHTLLARLVQKGALDVDKTNREYVFEPRIEADESVHHASRSFLRRFFDGELAPFLACFLEREKLSPKEIDELKRILEGKKR